MQFNLLPFVVEAIGSNQAIYKDIDNLYQTDKYRFYKAAKDHELYTHQIVTEGSLLQEEYCKKALGILLCADDPDINEGLSAILRKGWTYAHLYIANHSQIDLGKFIKNAARKSGGIEKVSDDWINAQMLFAYFLALNNGREIVKNEWLTTFEQTLIGRWEHYKDDSPTRISLKNATPENIEKVRKLKLDIYAKYGRFTDFNGLYGKLNARAETMAMIFDFEKLSCESVFNKVSFTEKDLEELLLAYVVREQSSDTDKAADFICDAMYVRYMVKAYKEVKERYFENNIETAYVELEGMEKDLVSAGQEVVRLSRALSELRQIHVTTAKENTRLKGELAEEKKNRQELNSLREFLFSLDQQEEYMEEESYNLDELKNYKAVLIGGHERWQARMKELLPECIFIHPDNKAFDVRILENISTIFIYTNYLNHAMYNKAMDYIANKDVKVRYIHQVNEKMVLSDIYRAMKE